MVSFETPRALETAELPRHRRRLCAGREERQGRRIRWRRDPLRQRLTCSTSFLKTVRTTAPTSTAAPSRTAPACFLEVTDAVIDVWGKGARWRTAFPLRTPWRHARLRPVALFSYVLQQLSERGIAYAHVVEPRTTGAGGGRPTDDSAPRTAHIFRKAFQGVLISAAATRRPRQRKPSPATTRRSRLWPPLHRQPDLPERFRHDTPLNTPERSTFYGGAEKGYTWRRRTFRLSKQKGSEPPRRVAEQASPAGSYRPV